VPLFDPGRTTGTTNGSRLLSYGKILTLCQETCRAIEDLQNLQGGTLIVGASNDRDISFAPHDWLVPAKYPDVAVQLRSSHTPDCGCGKWTVRPSNCGVRCQANSKTPWKCSYAEDELVLPVFHPFAKRDTIQRRPLQVGVYCPRLAIHYS